MKSFRKELWFETGTRRAFINITPKVDASLADSGVREGLCLVNAMHITASVFINDDERGLHSDYQKVASALSQLDFRVHELQLASCVFDFHLPINASLPRVNIS